jgi:hypothetical protein
MQSIAIRDIQVVESEDCREISWAVWGNNRIFAEAPNSHGWFSVFQSFPTEKAACSNKVQRAKEEGVANRCAIGIVSLSVR